MPWVWIIGTQRTASRITSSTNLVKLHSTFTTGNHRMGLQNILFSGSTNVYLDLQTLGGSGSVVLELQSAFINNDFTFKGRSTADFVESWTSQILGNIRLYCLSFNLKGNLLGNLFLNDVGSQSGSNGVIGTLTSNLMSAATFNKSLDLVWNVEFKTSNATSWTINAIGGTNGNLKIYSDALLPTTITKNTAYINIYAPNPPTRSGKLFINF
jgi:hypothetical protein